MGISQRLATLHLAAAGCWVGLLAVVLSSPHGRAQAIPPRQSTPPPAPQLNVNWLYGAYVPKDVPLEPLTAQQRLQLFLRQSFTTPGIYVKTMLFSIGDQINNSPPDWGTGFGGYARRVGSRQTQFVLQNSFVALGNGILGYEPRYNRCRCSGFWQRTSHALARNLVTYDHTEKTIRPQFAMYGGAFAAGILGGTWKPSDRNLLAEGYRGAITQVGFGFTANWLAEFAPDIKQILRRARKTKRIEEE